MEEASILDTIKHLIGIQEDDESFDIDILVAINSVLSVLTQLGVGPSTGFIITSNSETWKDFLQNANTDMQSVISYIHMRVKLMFDPPLSATASEAMNSAIKEFEWRLHVDAESKSEESK